MTMPYERTKVVIETRELLRLLARSDANVSRTIHGVARHLLRHFPLRLDIDVSATALPGVLVERGTISGKIFPSQRT